MGRWGTVVKQVTTLYGAVYLSFTVCVLILIKVLAFPECWSFDTHDDANHAFPNLYVAQKMILGGVLPTINYFNNFGVPLLGDGLTYPFGLQSIPYYFFEPHVSMTLIRCVVFFSTTMVFYLFFKLFLHTPTALLCSLLSILVPIAFWYPVHHYQLASFFGFSLIITSYKFLKTEDFRFFLLMAVFWILMVLSVSINHVILFFPFWILWCLTNCNFSISKKFFVTQLAMLSGLMFTFLQTYEFFIHFADSGRVGEGVYHSVLTDIRELILGAVIPPGEWLSYNYGAQLQVATYISFPIIVLVSIGVVCGYKAMPRWNFWSIFLCGVVPTVLALALYILPEIRLRLPVVKTGDITRVLWFSMPFCIVSVGLALELMDGAKIKKPVLWLIIALSCCALVIIWLIPEFEGSALFHKFVMLLFAAAIFCHILVKLYPLTSIYQVLGRVMLYSSLTLAMIPTTTRILGLNSGYCGGTQYSATAALSEFYPSSFLEDLAKGTRLAAEVPTYKGHDLRLAAHGLLGSGARAIIVDKKFGEILEERGLVSVDQVPYGYFFSRPWDTDALTEYGIRYLVINHPVDPELEALGWARINSTNDYSIYENPTGPTPIYFQTGDLQTINFVQNYLISGNHIRADFAQSNEPRRLVVAMMYRDGYRAQVDGRAVTIIANRNGLMEITVPENSTSISISHSPYSIFVVGIFFILSVGILIVARAVSGQTNLR